MRMSAFVHPNWNLDSEILPVKGMMSILTFMVNPFTPKSYQFQISPAASLEVLHHTVWRTWLFIAYSDERWLYYQFSLLHLYIFSVIAFENVLPNVGDKGEAQINLLNLKRVFKW